MRRPFPNRLTLSFPATLLLCGALSAAPVSAQTSTESAHQLIAQAEAYALGGNYDGALPLYEQAIAKLAAAPREQQQLRYRYGIVLNALGGARPDLYPLARSQFKAVLDYIEAHSTTANDATPPPLEHSAARVRSALAHTYHQQAATVERPGEKSNLLRNAYFLYANSISELRRERDWQNLAITYFNIGQVCEWQGNLEEAIDWLEKAVKLDHEHGFDDLEEDRQYLSALRQQVNPQNYGATAL